MKTLLGLTVFALVVYGCNSSSSNENKSGTNQDALGNKTITAKVDSMALPPEHYTKKGDDIGFELMDSEKLGDIKIGMPKEQVIKLLGHPEIQTDTSIDQANAMLSQGWSYKKKGIAMSMEGESYAELKIMNIAITHPCTYKLKRRIGIGSTVQEIKDAYPRALNKEQSSDSLILLGSVYGGIQFIIHNNKVDTLFIGATAE